jgi:hypothetical protein
MSERLPEGDASAFKQDDIRPAVLAHFEFGSGAVRLWAPGVGPIQWGGFEWTGCGALGSIGDLEETSEGRAVSTELELSPVPLVSNVDGVDIDILAIAFHEEWRLKPVRIFLGLFEATSLKWKVEPFQVRKGFMDTMELTEAGQVAKIKLTLESRYFDLERADVLRYTMATQRARFPLDAFFDQVSALQDKEITWNLGPAPTV